MFGKEGKKKEEVERVEGKKEPMILFVNLSVNNI